MSDDEGTAGTSPPSSIAPQSDDEFTSALMRHAAKQLGLNYSGSAYRPVRTTGVAPAEESFVDARERSRFGVEVTAAEIMRQIELHRKALGDNHETVAQLCITAARIFAQQSNSLKAEHYFTMAMDILENVHGRNSVKLLPVISETANYFAGMNQFFNAQVLFVRAAEICEKSQIPNSNEAAGLLRSPQDSQRSLKRALASYAQERKKSVIANSLVEDITSSFLVPKRSIEAMKNVETQVDVDQGSGDGESVPSTSHFAADISEEQRSRLREPTLRTATDLRKLIEHVKDGPSHVSTTSIADRSRGSFQGQETVTTSLARTAADNLQRTLQMIRSTHSK